VNAQEIRAHTLDSERPLNESVAQGLQYLQFVMLREIAAQLAEMNERQASEQFRPTHRTDAGRAAWECGLCHTIVYSEGHYRSHMDEHEKAFAEGGAR
jgi:hypothetical protein